MTADGTYPVPRAGVTVSTADYLRELADRARVMGDEAWGPLQPKQWRFFADWLGSLIEAGEPNGVLFRPDAPAVDEELQIDLDPTPEQRADQIKFAEENQRRRVAVTIAGGEYRNLHRPDAPQPATGGDAVERAARGIVGAGMTGAGLVIDTPLARHLARAALAAARAGEAEGDRRCTCATDGDARRCPLHTPQDHAAQRGGEAVEREALTRLAARWEASPEYGAGAYADELRSVLAARGDAAPTEVEWGVRYDGRDRPDLMSEEDAQALSEARPDRYTLVQRTVSAWREVTP